LVCRILRSDERRSRRRAGKAPRILVVLRSAAHGTQPQLRPIEHRRQRCPPRRPEEHVPVAPVRVVTGRAPKRSSSAPLAPNHRLKLNPAVLRGRASPERPVYTQDPRCRLARQGEALHPRRCGDARILAESAPDEQHRAVFCDRLVSPEQRIGAATAVGASNAEPARATLLTARESAGIDRAPSRLAGGSVARGSFKCQLERGSR
jgi:hypothetical protein